MKKIAIDIALIPPDNILEKCIEFHNSCEFKRFQLGKSDFVPHISLTLMGIYEKDLDSIIEIISHIYFKTLNISLTGISSKVKKEGEYNMIDVHVDKGLQSLHEEIIEKTYPFFQTADKLEMIVNGEETGWDTSSKQWINKFYAEHSLKRYEPHITLGCYNLDYSHIHFPITFECSRLCIFQVGNSNTCRKLLWEKIIINTYEKTIP